MKPTYRLQLSPSFGFADATAVVPYLAELGVGTLYFSPYFRARPGSDHGYDVVDHNQLNPELGDERAYQELAQALRERGLAQLVDFVPNHMGIGGRVNPWWADVLEWGERSPYAKYFDIDWNPRRSDLTGRVLLPFLGDHYGRVLERGDLVPAFIAETGTLEIHYYDWRFPLAPETYAPVLSIAADLAVGSARAELQQIAAGFAALQAAPAATDVGALRATTDGLKRRLARLAGEDAGGARAMALAVETMRARESDTQSVDRLDDLLARQHYRLAFWRVSLYEINYRRFFDINELAGLRVEDAEVLGRTHRLVLELIARGDVQGLRIDHVDGLYNPAAYCRYLRDATTVAGTPIALYVEKILARFESPRAGWHIDGTTGYDFMNVVNGLFVNPRAELAFDRIYAGYAPSEETFDAAVFASKLHIVRNKLASELTVLTSMLFRIAGGDRHSNDFTYDGLRDALLYVTASFPVYRTYVTPEGVDPEDRRYIEWAVTVARKHAEILDASVFDFIHDVLTLDILHRRERRYDAQTVQNFVMKFQQFTGPVMAKSAEDTAFYRYVRLISLNEVGGDPKRFGTTVGAFHRHNRAMLEAMPRTMLATATHDHKRGEDARLRIDALSEMPGRWRKALRTFDRLAKNGSFVDSERAPSRNDQYALYQTLIGSWPAEWLERFDETALDPYVERISVWFRKAIREAKLHSSWTNPNELYEEASLAFARRLFEEPQRAIFLRDFLPVARDAALVGMVHSLAQTTLKMTSPGVPDLYQGCEFWDLSLVDPDNRRPVDFAARRAALADIRRLAGADQPAAVRELLRSWPDGRIKMYLTHRLLELRAGREGAAALESLPYERLPSSGQHAGRLIGFSRGEIAVVASRLVYPLLRLDGDGVPRLRFRDETVTLPSRGPRRYRELFTGRTFEASGKRPRLGVGNLLQDLPVAVLLPE